MPKTEDKFQTVLRKGFKGPTKTFPSTATVIRKGSKAGEKFAKEAGRFGNTNFAYDGGPGRIDRKVGRDMAADDIADDAEREAERSKYAK
jgi:hypothetical protein